MWGVKFIPYAVRTGHVIRRMRLCAVAKNAMSMVGYPVKDVRPMTEREREFIYQVHIHNICISIITMAGCQ